MGLNRSIACFIAFLACAFVYGENNLDYSDLEALGIDCPELDARFKCFGYTNNRSHDERGCECDADCNTYNDCCIDAPSKETDGKTFSPMTCQPVGETIDGGVYVISTCRKHWMGPSQIHQKCQGPDDLSDPLNAAPVIDGTESLTYRNRYCAECNGADMDNLTSFQIIVSCEGLSILLPDEEILADLKYDKKLDVWGVDRLNSTLNEVTFHKCDILFDVPKYSNNSMRLCRSNIISSCPPASTRYRMHKACTDYTAVVYNEKQGYRNPHCAICNGLTVKEIECKIKAEHRKRPMSFALFVDINQSDGDQVGMTWLVTPRCPSKQKYDPFSKTCRRLQCAFSGYVLVNGKCARQV